MTSIWKRTCCALAGGMLAIGGVCTPAPVDDHHAWFDDARDVLDKLHDGLDDVDDFLDGLDDE